MKKLLLLMAVVSALVSVSCADSISEIENTYQRGIERAEKAQSAEELSQITIDVRNELIDGAKGLGGDRKLSNDEMHRFHKAQHDFVQAIDTRYYQLTGQCGIWSEMD